MVEAAPLAWFELDVASQSVVRRSHGHDNDEVAGTVVDDVSGDHDRWANECRFAANGTPQVDIKDLAPPNQAMASHSCGPRRRHRARIRV